MTEQKINYIKIIQELGKVRISLPIALSAFTGYIIFDGKLTIDSLLLVIGVFFMSCSSAALNHIQEYKTDKLMPRTKNRPIPSGKIKPFFAVVTAIAFFVIGASFLLVTFKPEVFVVSLLTLISYNVVYTPLKQITAFAVVPGSFVGALPPYIGWIAAGGNLLDIEIFWVALFFFIGQIPHFWLLLLMFGKEYEMAGFPSLHKIFTENQIKRLSFTWIIATISSAIVVAVKVFENNILTYILLAYILYILVNLSIEILVKNDLKVRPSFFKLNILYLFMMILLIIDSFI